MADQRPLVSVVVPHQLRSCVTRNAPDASTRNPPAVPVAELVGSEPVESDPHHAVTMAGRPARSRRAVVMSPGTVTEVCDDRLEDGDPAERCIVAVGPQMGAAESQSVCHGGAIVVSGT